MVAQNGSNYAETTLDKRKISVVIPAYNKAEVLFSTLQNIITQLKLETDNFEIIVVNDGSTDSTLEKAISFKKSNGFSDKVKVHNLEKNFGKGHALCFGFGKSSGDLIIFADGDLDLPARNFRVALAYLDQNCADIAIGSKRHPQSSVSYPVIRRFYSWCYQTLIRFLFNLNVSDTQVGLKVFRREILEKVIPKIVVKAFAFDLELLVVAKSAGFTKIAEFPTELKHGLGSTINFTAVKNILVDTFGIFYRKAILRFYEEKPTQHLQPLLLSKSRNLVS